jgi:hypothetical protein
MIAQRLPGDEVAGLKELFASMDLDGDGSITVQELSTVLSSKGAKLPQEEIEVLPAKQRQRQHHHHTAAAGLSGSRQPEHVSLSV